MPCSSYTFIWRSSDANFMELCIHCKKARLVRNECGWMFFSHGNVYKFNMAAKTGSRNNLHSSSDIDAVWKLITSFWVMLKYIILCSTCELDIEPCNSQYGSCNRSNMAAQSGRTCISQTMIDSVEILTAQALQNFNKALPNDRDNDRLRYSIPVLFSVTHCQCKCIYAMEWKYQNNIFAIVCHSNKCVVTYRKSMNIIVILCQCVGYILS